MIIKISKIQIFTETKISIFEKVVNFLKNPIKNESTLNFFWDEETCLIKDEKIQKIKASQSQKEGVKLWLT
jgi:hypothetical protein